MHRLGLFSPGKARAGARAALAFLPLVAFAQQGLTREGGQWAKTLHGTEPAAPRLRVNAHGPVTLEGGVSDSLSYSVKVSVRARTEAQARRILERYAVRVARQGEWTVFTTPGGAVLATVSMKAPRLDAAVISASDGAVEVSGVDGPLDVNTGGGELRVDRVGGDCRLITGGGDIRVGQAGGKLHAATGSGRITVGTVRGEAVLETNGGDIVITEVGGPVRAETGGGEVRITTAGASVTATTGGGRIMVGKAGGVVIARNMAGPVQIGAAAGVECESVSGGIRLSNIWGAMQVSTSMGSIFASLLGGKLADSFLATGNGDITVTIPSNVGVNIRAANQMADTIRRISSEFPGIQVRRQGTRLVAEGPVNGGGPLLQISATSGTITIKRQQ
jgi:DUF4097 and DUF4098 domain-containing protein YvlB